MLRLLSVIFVLSLLWGGCQKDPVVVIETDYGIMKARLYDATPQHRDNFLKLAREGFYDSLLFHRVVPNFMVQGGDPNSRNAAPGQRLGGGDPGYTIPAELVDTLYHVRGALAAARTPNPEKASSGSQFYIVQGRPWSASNLAAMEQQMGKTFSEKQKQEYMEKGGYPPLDGDYTVFGQVFEGMEVIDKIAKLPTDGNARPVQDVRMKVWIE